MGRHGGVPNPCSDQRAECRESQHGDASVEAAGFASDAPEEKAHAVGAERVVGRSSRAETPTVLAATLLRLQCMEREEAEREDELHAFQSSEERAGDASSGLVMERLWFLFQDRGEFVRAESGVETGKLKSGENLRGHVKTRTLHTPKGFGTPASFSRS